MGQESPPVPPPPTGGPSSSSDPGFGPQNPSAPTSDEEELEAPISVPDQGRNERLIELIADTTGEITLESVIDEVLADVVAELDARPYKRLSPMAIREIRLGSNVKRSFATRLEGRIVTLIHSGTRIKMKRCLECMATRTQVDGDKWTVTRGLVSTEQMKALSDRLGVKTFLDIGFGFDAESQVLEMQFTLIRGEDGLILWSEVFRADETTPMLMRSSDAPQRRSDRLRDLEMLLEGRPFYGYHASAGFMLIPYGDPQSGDIGGATAGFRVYERFGVDRLLMFGLDVQGFFNPDRLAGAVVSAGGWWVPIRPDFIHPELRVGGKVGGFVAGSEGNAAMFQLGAEVILRYRFGLYGYAFFMTNSTFNGFDLGGVGFSAGMSFNW